MKICEGIPVSPGIAIHDSLVLRPQISESTGLRPIAESRVEREIERFHAAVKKACSEIDAEVDGLEAPFEISRQVLGSHRDMMADPVFGEEVARCIRERRIAAESAVDEVIRVYLDRFERMASSLLRVMD